MGSLGKQNGISHFGSFLLGALLPTLLLVFLASDRVGERLSSISNFGNGCLLKSLAQDQANLTSSDVSAPAGQEEIGFAGLAELLPKVAMEDRTVILTMVNEAWAQPNSLLHLYRESFKNGENIEHLLNHVLVIAVDAGGFAGCKAIHPHCYLLDVKSTKLSSPGRFMTKEFLELVWLKVTFQQRILELGYNFLFTDTDMIWFRNPFRHITVYADMSCSTDYFRPATSSPLDKVLNTGFYFVKSTNRSIEMIKYWRAARERFPGNNEQGVFNNVKHELVTKLQVRIEPLDTLYFSGFCNYHNDLEKVCTMHANCCIGLENKVPDLKDKAADWRNYTSLTPEERKKGSFKWTVPARCWKSIGRRV